MPKANSVNKAILVGNVGQDPEVKYTASGVPVAKLSVATNERFKDKNGQWQDRTEWHNVVAWQRLAEIVGEYVRKGSKNPMDPKMTPLAVYGAQTHIEGDNPPDGVVVQAGDNPPRLFDAAVVAVHPDQALLLLDGATPRERAVLSAIPYSTNRAQLHTDSSVLPRTRSIS